MTKEQFIMMLLQKVSQESNDQALGEWVRRIVWNLKLDESTQDLTNKGPKLLRD
jgi:hypothetical protein